MYLQVSREDLGERIETIESRYQTLTDWLRRLLSIDADVFEKAPPINIEEQLRNSWPSSGVLPLTIDEDGQLVAYFPELDRVAGISIHGAIGRFGCEQVEDAISAHAGIAALILAEKGDLVLKRDNQPL